MTTCCRSRSACRSAVADRMPTPVRRPRRGASSSGGLPQGQHLSVSSVSADGLVNIFIAKHVVLFRFRCNNSIILKPPINSLRLSDICVSKLTIIGSDNDLSPGWRQAIIWAIAGILLIWILRTNFSEIHTFSFKIMHLKMFVKWRPFCLGLNVLSLFADYLITFLCLRLNSLRPSGAIWQYRSESTLAQVMACCLTAPSHYLNQCWLIISKV